MHCFIRPLTLVFVLMLSGCAVTVHMPMNRFETPETLGQVGKIKIDASYSANQYVELTDDYTVTAPNMKTPKVFTDTDFDLGGSVAVDRKVDVGIRDLAVVFGKYQILGEPRPDAKQGNFSVAVQGGLGMKQSGGTGTVAFTEDQRSYAMKELIIDLAALAGYRIWDGLLVYGGPSYTSNSVSMNYALIPKVGNRTATDKAISISTLNLHLGVETGSPRFSWRAETGVSSLTAGSVSTFVLSLGAMVSVLF